MASKQYAFLVNAIKSHDSNDCLMWPYSCQTKGYGQVRVWIGGLPLNCRVHRVAYGLTHGAFNQSLPIRHSCDVPGCFNPRHLLAGTAKQNTQDAIQRGRLRAIGITNPQATLDDDKVRQIRAMFLADTRTIMQKYRWLAQMFGVTKTGIQSVIEHRTWKHVD